MSSAKLPNRALTVSTLGAILFVLTLAGVTGAKQGGPSGGRSTQRLQTRSRMAAKYSSRVGSSRRDKNITHLLK
jgi:hypothetical protein